MTTTTISKPARQGRKPASKAKRIGALLAKGYPPAVVAKKVNATLQYVYSVKAKTPPPAEPVKPVEVPVPSAPPRVAEMAVYAPSVQQPKPTMWARFRDWIGV